MDISLVYVDLTFLLILYVFSCISLGVSIYALWTLNEVLAELRKKPKVRIVKVPVETKPKPKGIWD